MQTGAEGWKSEIPILTLSSNSTRNLHGAGEPFPQNETNQTHSTLPLRPASEGNQTLSSLQTEDGEVSEVVYFGDVKDPPPFGHLLEGAVGYISQCGQKVLYGSMRTRGWPDGDNLFKQEREPFDVKAFLARLPKKRKGPPHRKSPVSKQCKSCGDTTSTTGHHIKPRAEMTRDDPMYSVTVQLCDECHVLIHKLFSTSELAKMTWDAQHEALKNHSAA